MARKKKKPLLKTLRAIEKAIRRKQKVKVRKLIKKKLEIKRESILGSPKDRIKALYTRR